MGLEDAVCPYCGTPNTMAVKHQSDMNHFRQEYQRTQADVIEKTSLLQRHGSWLVILVVLLVALVVAVILLVNSWEIGYSIRENNVQRNMATHSQVMDGYLEQGDYGLFVGYYNTNDVSLADDDSYEGVWSAANSYSHLVEGVSSLYIRKNNSYRPEYYSETCVYLADDLIKIYTLEKRYSYNQERYIPADKRAYIDDIRARTAVLAKTYFGLTDEDLAEIPNLSSQRLGALIEERIAK